MRALTIALAIAAIGTAASAAQPAACPSGLHTASTAEFFFGAVARDDVSVTDDDWASFVHDEVAPRFPGGMAVNAVYGASDQPKGGFERQASRAVVLVLTGGADEAANIKLVRDAYQRRFHDDQIDMVEHTGCVAF